MNNDTASEMAFFVLVARLGSLAAAARALDLTPPAATKRLAQMEARLGVRLVNRTTRRISLTGEGETYLMHATRILADIRAMEDELAGAGGTLRGLLRVNATLGFGRTAIAPLLSAFAKQHPQVEVQMEVTDRPVDLAEQGFDLAIRFGAPPDQRLVARRVMSNRRFLCATPQYLEQHGRPCRSPLHPAPAERRRLRHLAFYARGAERDRQGAWRTVQQRRRHRTGLGAGRARHTDPLGVGFGQVCGKRTAAHCAAAVHAAGGGSFRGVSRAGQPGGADAGVHRLSGRSLRRARWPVDLTECSRQKQVAPVVPNRVLY